MTDEPKSLTEQVIDIFGGVSALAKALGHNNVTTVDGWKRKQKIPHWRDHEIIEAAKRNDKTLPDEFLQRQQPARPPAGGTEAGKAA